MVLTVVGILTLPLAFIFGKTLADFGISVPKMMALLPPTINGSVLMIGGMFAQLGYKQQAVRFSAIGGMLFVISLAILFAVNFL